MIFLDTNVVSESLKKSPDVTVIEWLVQHDAELALSTVAIAEISLSASKRSDLTSARRGWNGVFSIGAAGSQVARFH